MKLVARNIHPIFFSLFPILSFYSDNVVMVRGIDILKLVGMVWLAAAALWLILFAIVRDVQKSAISVSVAALFFFFYRHIWHLLDTSPRFGGSYTQLQFQCIWFLIAAVFVALPLYKWKNIAPLTRFFNTAGVVLVLMPTGNLIYGAWRAKNAIASLPKAEIHNIKLKPGTARPDIFYIILDGYGRVDALKQFLDFDNSRFVGDLKKRGFFVADKSRSNYCQTQLSLASSLNLDFVQNLLTQDYMSFEARAALTQLVDQSRVASYLRKLGYKYVGVTSGAPNITLDSADFTNKKIEGENLAQTSMLSDTTVGAVKGAMFFQTRRAQLNNAFGYLQGLNVVTPEPRFVFVHILAPHPPFVFNASGGTMARPGPASISDASEFMSFGGTQQDYKAGYQQQALYVNQRVLEIVDSILKKEDSTPVILIQGDHGSRMLMDQEHLATTDVRECFRNLSAFYVPPAVRAKLYDGITPVNSFRILFDSLFGDNWKTLPDNSYYSPYTLPYEFAPVSSAAIEGTPPSG